MNTMKAVLTRALSSQPGPLSAREQALENVWAKQQDEMQLQRLSHATPPKLRDELKTILTRHNADELLCRDLLQWQQDILEPLARLATHPPSKYQ